MEIDTNGILLRAAGYSGEAEKYSLEVPEAVEKMNTPQALELCSHLGDALSFLAQALADAYQAMSNRLENEKEVPHHEA